MRLQAGMHCAANFAVNPVALGRIVGQWVLLPVSRRLAFLAQGNGNGLPGLRRRDPLQDALILLEEGRPCLRQFLSQPPAFCK